MEMVLDTGSSSLTQSILKIAKGQITSLVIDLNLLVEGQCDEDLPERLLGGVRFAHCALNDVVPRAPPVPAPVAAPVPLSPLLSPMARTSSAPNIMH
jgi:hypothetical protein